MRIALLYDAVYPWVKGGGEKYFYDLAVQLRDRGHTLHVLGMHWWDGPAEMVHEGIHYHAVCRAAPLYTSSGRRRMSTVLRFAWGLLWRLPRYRRYGFDLVNVAVFPFVSVPVFWLIHLLLLRRSAWLATWFEVWGLERWQQYSAALGRGGALVERGCARLAPFHACISPTTARRLQTLLGVSPDRIATIPIGFRRPQLAALPAERERWKVVVVGRMVPHKRVDLAIRAWPEVVSRLPQAELHVIGAGPEQAACMQLAETGGAASAVHFCGMLPDAVEVLKNIASAALLLQPSEREGQSLVVLEALSLGTPVLAADGPETAIGDFFGRAEPMHEALLPVEAGPEAWADRIVRLLTDQAMRERLAAKGRSLAAELDWDTAIFPRTLSLYEALCSGARR